MFVTVHERAKPGCEDRKTHGQYFHAVPPRARINLLWRIPFHVGAAGYGRSASDEAAANAPNSFPGTTAGEEL